MLLQLFRLNLYSEGLDITTCNASIFWFALLTVLLQYLLLLTLLIWCQCYKTSFFVTNTRVLYYKQAGEPIRFGHLRRVHFNDRSLPLHTIIRIEVTNTRSLRYGVNYGYKKLRLQCQSLR